MIDPTLGATAAAKENTSDEHQVLSALLHKLESADHLSLDELDTLIRQADAAYKRRLARLTQTKQMIEQLGTSGERG